MPCVLGFGGGRMEKKGKSIGRVRVFLCNLRRKVLWDFEILGVLTWLCWQSKVGGCYRIKAHSYLGAPRPSIFHIATLWRRQIAQIVPMYGIVCWLLNKF